MSTSQLLKRQAARILNEQCLAEKQEQQRLVAARELKRARLMGLAPAPAGGVGSPSRPANGTSPSALPTATPQSQYHAAHLLDQLKSPGGSATSPAGGASVPTSPAGVPRGAHQQVPLAGAASASASATLVNISTWSYEQWSEWRLRWNTHQLMYWQFYGIRRTRQEQQTRQRVLQMQSTDGADEDAAPVAEGVDGAELELSQAEQEDLLLSPHCRTFFNAAHFHLYPLRLANVAGVTLSFDDDPTVFDLHIGEKYNTNNPDGVTGREMWEAVW